MKTQLLTILIPVYNEENCIPFLYRHLLEVAEILPCEIEFLFVNDGSTDSSLSTIRHLQQKDSRISIVDLSRNFGKEKAVSAGIDYAKGNTLTILDADLQDPPELIPLMWREIENGYDDVYACRTSRKGETHFKCWSARTYYRWLHYLANIPIQEDTGDFRMFSEKAICALRQLKECERNMKGLFSFIGLKKKAIYYERNPRIAGSTFALAQANSTSSSSCCDSNGWFWCLSHTSTECTYTSTPSSGSISGGTISGSISGSMSGGSIISYKGEVWECYDGWNPFCTKDCRAPL